MSRYIFSILLAAAVAGCTTTGATLGSGVGDAMLQRPPYYAGAAKVLDAKSIVRLPVAWQRGASDSPIFEPKSDGNSEVAALLDEMDRYLDSLRVTTRIERTASLPAGTPPDVIFGCNVRHGDDCEESEGQGIVGRGGPRMRLAVGRPSADWISEVARAADASGASHVLVITLEAGQYHLRQKGWQGRKVVELGTDYAVSFPWLTSLEHPVNVIQITGALMDRDGKAVKIGAEGLIAKRTPLLVSALGAQSLVSDDDVRTLRNATREDLPGQPLVWQAALRTLVERLVN
jgi:hypothetical protein